MRNRTGTQPPGGFSYAFSKKLMRKQMRFPDSEAGYNGGQRKDFARAAWLSHSSESHAVTAAITG